MGSLLTMLSSGWYFIVANWKKTKKNNSEMKWISLERACDMVVPCFSPNGICSKFMYDTDKSITRHHLKTNRPIISAQWDNSSHIFKYYLLKTYFWWVFRVAFRLSFSTFLFVCVPLSSLWQKFFFFSRLPSIWLIWFSCHANSVWSLMVFAAIFVCVFFSLDILRCRCDNRISIKFAYI